MVHRKARRTMLCRTKQVWVWLLLCISCWSSCRKKAWDEAVEELQLPFAGTAVYHAVLVDEQDRVFVLGGDRFERNDFIQSEDNGASWTIYHFTRELYSNKTLYAGCLRDHAVYASGYDGKLFRNTSFVYDAWVLNQGPFFWYSHTGIAFGPGIIGCVVGHTNYNDGIIERIDTATQRLQVDSFPFALNDVAFADAATVFAVGYGAVLRSTDTARTWQQLNLTDDNYRAVYCVDKDNVWTVGFNGTIAHLTRNGAAYEKIKNGQNPLGNADRYLDITFRGAYGFIVGEKGVVLYTRDAGAHWQRMKRFTREDLYSVAIHPLRNVVYFVGSNNAAFRAVIPET